MHLARISFGAVQLAGGKVQVVGNDNVCGSEGVPPDSVQSEIWDPKSGRWTKTPDRSTPRQSFVFVALGDGRALLTGGYAADSTGPGGFQIEALTSLYEPAANKWTPGPPMTTARAGAAGAKLLDGRVLVAGGLSRAHGLLDSAEIYDPRRNAWAKTGSMIEPMEVARGVTLADGRALVLGSYTEVLSGGESRTESRTELYDPTTAKWTRGAPLVPFRDGFVLVALPDGGALVAGGQVLDPSHGFAADRSALRLDPQTLKWIVTRPMPTRRSNAVAVVLTGGRVLVAGGSTAPGLPHSAVIATAAVYDPQTGGWSSTASMPNRRADGAAVALIDGSVLVIGGDTGYVKSESSCPPSPLATTVRYVPASP